MSVSAGLEGQGQSSGIWKELLTGEKLEVLRIGIRAKRNRGARMKQEAESPWTSFTRCDV